jgi:hypothetical protein
MFSSFVQCDFLAVFRGKSRYRLMPGEGAETPQSPRLVTSAVFATNERARLQTQTFTFIDDRPWAAKPSGAGEKS